jgi:hypothetical protein
MAETDIVIGRRASLSEEQLGKKAAFRNTDTVEVMTYDRLIDAAKAWDTDKGEKPGIPYSLEEP